jgi:hypothetical protein
MQPKKGYASFGIGNGIKCAYTWAKNNPQRVNMQSLAKRQDGKRKIPCSGAYETT